MNFEPGFVKKAAEEQVIVFCLPPHTTHLTQPLDKGCFGPPKIYWREECQDYIASNPGKVVTRFQFSQLFSWACYRGMTMHIITGFRITGVFPFNRHALRPSDKDLQPKSLSQQTGLKYIPLFSPAPAKHRSQAVREQNFNNDWRKGMILTLIQSMIFGRGCITRTTVLLPHLWLHTHLSLTSCLYHHLHLLSS